jgi:hypothetical protein
MKRLPILIAFIAIAVTYTTAQKPPKGDLNVSVVSSFDNSVPNLRVGDDGLGAYLNGVNNVESIVQAIGDWELNARNSTVRKIYIDFGDPVSGSEPAAPFGNALRPARFISKCASLGFKIRDMQVGQTRQCPLALAFDYNGQNYRIALNDANFSVTDYVQWTCLSSANGRCASWMMEPAAVYGDVRKSIGQLIKVGTNRKNPDQPLGRYYFSFRVYVMQS